MLRLLLSLICGLAIAGALLLMRQQRLELGHQCNALHDEMLETQKQLWSQQLQIASAVSPSALKSVLAEQKLRAAAERLTGLASDSGLDQTDEWNVLRD